MKNKYGRSHIGSTYKTGEGYDVKIINGGLKPGYSIIDILGHVYEVKTCHVLSGSIKYPFHTSVYGVGFIGDGEYSKSSDMKAYTTWANMIKRCYYHSTHVVQPTYVDSIVHKEWHNFQNFAKWFYKYYPRDGKKYDLDKDLRREYNKLYSPSTCIFIPHSLNAFMANTQKTNTSGYIGVSFNRRDELFEVKIKVDSSSMHLGSYHCIRTASRRYQEAREIQVKRWQDYYSFDYPKSVLNGLAKKNIEQKEI